jgi:MbtH protein
MRFREIKKEPLAIGILRGEARAGSSIYSIQMPASARSRRRMLEMTDRSESDEAIYLVVVNDEEQYSIWPDDKGIPAGWRAVGTRGPKAECLQYIEQTWTDMRPLSLRKRMAERIG